MFPGPSHRNPKRVFGSDPQKVFGSDPKWWCLEVTQKWCLEVTLEPSKSTKDRKVLVKSNIDLELTSCGSGLLILVKRAGDSKDLFGRIANAELGVGS